MEYWNTGGLGELSKEKIVDLLLLGDPRTLGIKLINDFNKDLFRT